MLYKLFLLEYQLVVLLLCIIHKWLNKSWNHMKILGGCFFGFKNDKTVAFVLKYQNTP